MTEEQELFAAVTKIDLADAVKHIRDWRCYIDNHNRQIYADLIEAQAKLIAHLIARAALAPEREYDPNVAPCDDAEFGMKP